MQFGSIGKNRYRELNWEMQDSQLLDPIVAEEAVSLSADLHRDGEEGEYFSIDELVE